MLIVFKTRFQFKVCSKNKSTQIIFCWFRNSISTKNKIYLKSEFNRLSVLNVGWYIFIDGICFLYDVLKDVCPPLWWKWHELVLLNTTKINMKNLCSTQFHVFLFYVRFLRIFQSPTSTLTKVMQQEKRYYSYDH